MHLGSVCLIEVRALTSVQKVFDLIPADTLMDSIPLFHDLCLMKSDTNLCLIKNRVITNTTQFKGVAVEWDIKDTQHSIGRVAPCNATKPLYSVDSHNKHFIYMSQCLAK